jgi:outer membrane protein assembly factor BamD
MRESFAAFKELVAKFPESRMRRTRPTGCSISRTRSGNTKSSSRATTTTAARTSRRSTGRRRRSSATRDDSNEAALDVLAKSYDKLGLVQLRDDTLAVLKKTFPDSVYLAGTPEKPWVEVLVGP